jgi:uncharacterized protein (TIGR03118 family)
MRKMVARLWEMVRGRRPRPQAPSYRPKLEGLEDRCLLAGGFFQRANLVSDQAGVAAIQDPDLVNGWGIALGPTGGNFWVSANGTDKTVLYRGDVAGIPFQKNPLVVSIPGGVPTGQVFNGTSDFVVSAGTASGPAAFIFASESGQITGWNPNVPLPSPSTQAQPAATVPGAVFKGLAIGSFNGQNFLYAADFRHNRIVVFDGHFNRTFLPGRFRDRHLPAGFAAFNIQNLGGKLYVTYAKQGDEKDEEEPGAGEGFVDVFNTDGTFVKRLISRGDLNAPWGLALAPGNFGRFSNALLVGNFGDGRIHAFNPVNGHERGTLTNRAGSPVRIDGLWGMTFGNGVTAGQTNVLYFAAGPDDEKHGLFGSLTAMPPGSL